MRVFIVSDHEPSSIKVREALLREGHDCPVAHVLSLDLARAQLTEVRPEMVVLVLSPDVQHALSALRDLRSLVPGRMLAVGPAVESQLILRTLREGADQYLDEADLEAEIQAALARLRIEEITPAERGRLIALLGPSGGSGSSTLAVNIATVLAKEHKNCALLDLKLEAGDLAALLDLKPTHTLADLCLNAAHMDRVMFERSLVRHATGVHVLAPPGTYADVTHVKPEGVRLAVMLARASFPYVVVDLDHSFREEQLEVLRQADVVLLILRLDFTSLRHALRTLEHLEQLGVGKEKVKLVVNRYGRAREVPRGKAEDALGMKILHYIPDDPKTINRANNNGVPVVLEAPSAKVSRSLTRLAASVNGSMAVVRTTATNQGII
jgi:pilus assembly protein CpaE